MAPNPKSSYLEEERQEINWSSQRGADTNERPHRQTDNPQLCHCPNTWT